LVALFIEGVSMSKIQLRLYRADTDYINFLQSADRDDSGASNVKDNEKNGNLRPYIKVLIDDCNGDYTYYIPVCSKKNKHYKSCFKESLSRYGKSGSRL